MRVFRTGLESPQSHITRHLVSEELSPLSLGRVCAFDSEISCHYCPINTSPLDIDLADNSEEQFGVFAFVGRRWHDWHSVGDWKRFVDSFGSKPGIAAA
jgi:hypothetical protein